MGVEVYRHGVICTPMMVARTVKNRLRRWSPTRCRPSPGEALLPGPGTGGGLDLGDELASGLLPDTTSPRTLNWGLSVAAPSPVTMKNWLPVVPFAAVCPSRPRPARR